MWEVHRGARHEARSRRGDHDPAGDVRARSGAWRFQREATTLAALNHPNIGGILGWKRRPAVTPLVLELVDGPTAADRIAQGSIPVAEALPVARQIAEALEAAHEHGIVDRDLN